VISNIRFRGSKKVEEAQPVAGQLSTGRPKVNVSIVLELELKTDGTLVRGKGPYTAIDKGYNFCAHIYNCQLMTYEIPVAAYSVTKTPPPACAKPAP
jgi:hypothetical protein